MIFYDKHAIVESDNIGHNSRVWAFTHVMKNVIIGKDCNVGEHCFIENGVQIGDRVTIKNGISIWDGAIIGNDVFLGPHMVFTNDLMPRSKNQNYKKEITKVEDGASIGANVTLLCGITIGKYSMIGAGSVVTKSVDDFSLVYGNPAKHVGFMCKCGEKLIFDNKNSRCKCGTLYSLSVNNKCEIIKN
ncbi:MAG: acyltransferase [Candidatus Delongbacteria bacterium]|jgi:UDP-2-acetamido-3-amino-2,3-dideoxy-glucuronate N-acetyltransferase|nr:acyltransferase [Candidatus Delongbacteria bacterium]